MSVIAIVRAQHTIPGKMIEKLLDGCAQMGFAVANEGAVDVFTVKDSEYPLNKALPETLEKYKDKTVLFHFCDYDAEEAEQQPFDLVTNEAGDCVMACAVEGDLDKYAKEGSEFGPEYTFINEFFAEKTNETFGIANDVDEFWKEITSDAFGKSLEEHLAPRGVVGLMASVSNPIMLSMGADDKKEFPWGVVSQSLGYEEEAPPAPKAPEPPKGGEKQDWRAKRDAKLKSTTAPATTPPAAVPEKDKSSGVPVVGQKTAETPAKMHPDSINESPAGYVLNLEGKLFLFPYWLAKNYDKHYPQERDRGKWYGQNRTQGRGGIKINKSPPIPAHEVNKNSPAWEFINAARNAAEAADRQKANVAKRDDKDVEPHHIPATRERPTPFMAGEIVEATNKWLNEHKENLTEKEINSPPESYVPFSKRMKIPIEDTISRSFASLYAMPHQALATWAHEVRLELIKRDPSLKKAVLELLTPKTVAPTDAKPAATGDWRAKRDARRAATA